ncbi:hypothetical protein NJB14197_53440 [Mycobacterium montefiorense]|uniref:Uncharacterized protein n=1 Tax=Mycobacterium montefiorense TaxID=154654 RepID=A0AA37PP84_9MYCO|nr:hypothetical protein MmonteBS_47580 [Mycobacterium montefiorense]GKU36515.1 hypothetical protein NJB14191_38610 [Mycobacterium montefiorense]GKU39444.1 hypothetical protein NJB14192_14380 [Mycobacterium montefiorense]GKU44566.1 hypothetical protein NJB14194_11920 [Mycobacterium montefiorense]GKU53952.1 hypothetical protein NJB14195_51930 [Mycobacterium montefiorense]
MDCAGLDAYRAAAAGSRTSEITKSSNEFAIEYTSLPHSASAVASAGKAQSITTMLSAQPGAVIGAQPTCRSTTLGGAALGEYRDYGDGYRDTGVAAVMV